MRRMRVELGYTAVWPRDVHGRSTIGICEHPNSSTAMPIDYLRLTQTCLRGGFVGCGRGGVDGGGEAVSLSAPLMSAASSGHLLTCVDLHWLALTCVDLHWFALTCVDHGDHIWFLGFVDDQWPSLTIIDHCWPSLTSVDYCWPSLSSLTLCWNRQTIKSTRKVNAGEKER